MCVCVCVVCFLPEMFNIWQKVLGVSVKDNCCLPFNLIAKFTCICTNWSSIKHFRHARRCKREPPSVTKWTCCGNCISRCLDSDYAFRKQFFIFHLQDNVCIFLKCMVLFPLNSLISFPPASSNQLWSPVHCLYSRGIGLHAKTQPNIFDLRVFRCIFLWWRTIWVAGSLHGNQSSTHCDTIMSKTVFIRSSFAFTSLDHVTFCLQQYVFKNRLLKLSLCLSTSIFHTISSWYPSSESLPDGHRTNIFAIVFSLMATRW